MDSATAPASADERRDPDQDTAVEKAFEAGTLPEEDRREPDDEGAKIHETALGVADGEGMHDRSAQGEATDADGARLKRLDVVIWNYLGEDDPEKVGDWIVGAIHELKDARKALEAFAAGQPETGTEVFTAVDETKGIEATFYPSEVLYAFAAWLTTRDETAGPFNRHHDSSQAAAIVQRFIKSQEYAPPREDWPSRFKPFPQD